MVWAGDGFQARSAPPVVWPSTLGRREIWDTAGTPGKVQRKMKHGKCHWDIVTFCTLNESEKVQTPTENWKRQLWIWVGCMRRHVTVHSFYPFYFRGVNLNMETSLRGLWHVMTLNAARNIYIYFDCGCNLFWLVMGNGFEIWNYIAIIVYFPLILTTKEMSNISKILFLENPSRFLSHYTCIHTIHP